MRTRSLLWVTLLVLGGCHRGGEVTLVRASGSSTIGPVVAAAAKAYEANYPDVRIEVETGGSHKGLADVRAGLVEIGMVSRALRPEEVQGWRRWLGGWDRIALVVHAENPVTNLTTKQVRAIYTGRIRSWSDLGGPKLPIVVVHKSAGRATRDVFLERFGLPATAVHAAVIAGENTQVILTVAGDRGAIGYVSVGAATVAARQGSTIHLVRLDGKDPTDPAYALGRELNLVTALHPSETTKAFLTWLLGPQGRGYWRRYGYLPAN